MSDPVNKPSHYTFGTIEPIDVIEDWQLGFHRGSAIQYIVRAFRKGTPEDGLEDIDKAIWYLDRYRKFKAKQMSAAPPAEILQTCALERMIHATKRETR